MNIAQQPYFLQAAGNVRKHDDQPGLQMQFASANPQILMTFTGEMIVRSLVDGLIYEEQYQDLTNTVVSIKADANTPILLWSSAKDLKIASIKSLTKSLAVFNVFKSRTPDVIDVSDCPKLSVLDFSRTDFQNEPTTVYARNCTGLTSFVLPNIGLYKLTTLDLSGCTALFRVSFGQFKDSLKYLNVSGCVNLSSTDFAEVRNAKELTYLDCSGCLFIPSGLEALTTLVAKNMRGGKTYKCPDSLTTIDISGSSLLQTLSLGSGMTTCDCHDCIALQDLYGGAAKNLQTLDLTGDVNLTSITAYSTVQSVATAMANAISTAISKEGTVTTQNTGIYVGSIHDAAINKGWTFNATLS